MRLVTFEVSGQGKRVGAVAPDGRIVDLNRACALYLKEVEKETAAEQLADACVSADMRRVFEGGDQSLAAARGAFAYALEWGGEARSPAGDPARSARAELPRSTSSGRSGSAQVQPIFYAREAVRLRAPIEPKKFFHTAGNFREHHEEAQRAGFSHPVLPWIVFFQNVDAIIGPDEPVVYPDQLTEELDYELELAVVVKKAGSFFTAEEAGSYIGGYVIFNDITARDIQRREMKSGVFSFCKGIRTFCPLGPWIVTADEIPDPQNLAMELRVNGEVRQRSHSSRMAVKIPEILAHYSPMGYSAGDVVSTGTVSGVAAFSGAPKLLYLKPGDVMEAEIEKIGVLRNPVISWEEAYGRKSPRAV